jgi:hypothetical protein
MTFRAAVAASTSLTNSATCGAIIIFMVSIGARYLLKPPLVNSTNKEIHRAGPVHANVKWLAGGIITIPGDFVIRPSNAIRSGQLALSKNHKYKLERVVP